MIYSFGDYELDMYEYELRHAGLTLQIEPKVFDFLVYLVRQRGQVVSKAALLDAVWPEHYVSESALTYCVMAARKAVGDDGRAQHVIKTVRGRGYRFIAPVQERSREVAVEPPLAVRPEAAWQTAHSMAGAERRQLTVLVGRVVPATPSTEQLDPEDLRDMVQHAREICSEVVRRYEGHIAQYLGDGFVVYFGYPQAHEDAARRAVHTGLGMLAGVTQLNIRLTQEGRVKLTVRVGIHTGNAVVDTSGSSTGPALSVLGDAPNVALQLQGLVTHGAVLISPATMRLVEGDFVCHASGLYALEGAAAPAVAYQVLDVSPTRGRLGVTVATGLTPLVGRAHEVGLLLERWDRAKDGMGQVVLLSGDAGIGKSRLAHVLREHLVHDVPVVYEYRCSPYTQHSPLSPLIEQLQHRLQLHRSETALTKLRKLEIALESYGFALDDAVPPMATLLSIPWDERYRSPFLSPQRRKQHTFAVLLAWLFKDAEKQGVLVIWEDLQWMDPTTLEWLSLCIEQTPTARLLMLVTFRPEFRPPWSMRSYLTHLTLGRLPRKQVGVMIKRIAGGKPLPPEVVRQLVAKADGVPLFVEELTKMALESGLLTELHGQYELTGGLPPLAIPATLRDSLMARLDRLGSAKQVAQLGAVVGREFTYELLQAITPVDAPTLQRELLQLVEVELLYQRGLPPAARYLFKHALLQEAAYASLLRSTRRQVHAKIARVLEEQFPDTRDTQPELFAYHYAGAGLQREAITYRHQAGLRATERSAYVEAVGHLRQALDMLTAWPDTTERCQQELMVLVALGVPLTGLKGYAAPEVERAYARARVLCKRLGETPQLFPVLHGLVRFYLVRGELQTAREVAEECLGLAQRVQDPALRMEAQGHLGVTLFYLGELEPARLLLEQVRRLYDAEAHRRHAFLYGQEPGVLCYGYLSIVLWLLGYPTQALQRCHDMLSLAQQQAHPYSLTFAFFLATWLHQMRGDIATMSQHAAATMASATEHGFPLLLSLGQRFWGWGLVAQGQAVEGLRQMSEGMAAFRDTGAESALTYTLVRLAEVYQRMQQVTEGLRALEDAVSAMSKGERFYTAEIYRLKGEFVHREAGGGQQAALRAAEWLHQAVAVARQQRAKSLELRATMSLSRLRQQQHKQREAYQQLSEVYDWFTEGFDTADLQAAQALLKELR